MKTVDAVAHYGTKSALARALGITPQAVSQWPDIVPAVQAIKLEQLTRGELRAVDHDDENSAAA